MSRFSFGLLGLVMSLPLLGGCGGSGPEFDTAVLGIIQQVQSAHDTVRHSGVRKVESYFELDGKLDPLAYREEIFTDGKSNFAIISLGASLGGLADPIQFDTLQELRSGFNHRYRDFRVRDLEAFLANYRLISNVQAVQVAGRDCVELAISRRDQSGSYLVALDSQNGLVLSYKHFDAAGKLYSMMEYETYNPNPDLSGVVFHKVSNQEIPITSASDLDFKLLIPKLLPSSAFHFLEATRITNPLTGTKLAKLTYTDGVEPIFFVDEGPVKATGTSQLGNPTATPVPVGPPAPPAGIPVTGSAGLSASHNPDGFPELALKSFHEGPLSALWGEIADHNVFLVGRASQLDLMHMLESALP